MKVEFSNKAVKIIERLDVPTKQRIRQAIYGLPDGDVKRLEGRITTWRLRVGGWRVLFSYTDKSTILIEQVSPRGQAYKEG